MNSSISVCKLLFISLHVLYFMYFVRRNWSTWRKTHTERATCSFLLIPVQTSPGWWSFLVSVKHQLSKVCLFTGILTKLNWKVLWNLSVVTFMSLVNKAHDHGVHERSWSYHVCLVLPVNIGTVLNAKEKRYSWIWDHFLDQRIKRFNILNGWNDGVTNFNVRF